MKKSYLPFVLLISLLIAFLLSAATLRINFWPTDSELAYIPSATQVFSTPFISNLHHATLFQYNIMHGKEALVVAIAIAQRILNDYESLFPNILVLIMAAMGSGILIFLILRRWLDEQTALVGFLLFATTFWTYQYVLQGAHQPLVMFNFLLTAYALMAARLRWRDHFLTGLALGLMLFSSPTAVVYGPYLAAAYFYRRRKLQPSASRLEMLKPILWITAGTILMILVFTLPDPLENFQLFLRFVKDSQQANHFLVVERLTGLELPTRGAGLIWILKYFALIMPVLFGIYAVSVLYLMREALKDRAVWIVILVGLSTPIIVETIQVAQFGRNYFSWLIGIILTVSYAFYHAQRHHPAPPLRRWRMVMLTIIFTGHMTFNAWAFLGDVLPSRMASTYVGDWLRAHPSERYAYHLHPHNVNITNVLNHPGEKNRIIFERVNSITQAQKGYMLVPMTMGKSIYLNCATPDFHDDPALTALIESGEIKNYIAASFPTMASSRFWPQEEEYCSYLDLIEGGISERDRALGHVWIIDAERLQRERFKK